ncbi:MAG: GNAT family N-acetyltransferase [Pseudomonadota bacterium]
MKFLVPEQLESDRLVLRQFQESDWKGLHKYYSDAVATKFTFGRVLSQGDSWRTMCGMIGHWQLRGYGPYAVEEKQSKSVIGTVGFWYPLDWPELEIKWGLARAYWRKGYAKEAASLVHRAGCEYLPDTALISLIHRDNIASAGVARAIGAEPESEVDYEGEPHVIYRHKSAR